MRAEVLRRAWSEINPKRRGISSQKRLKFDGQSGSTQGYPFEPSSIVLLAFPVASFALGVWQTKRRYWKLNLIDELEISGKKPPVDLPLTLEECQDIEYQKVRVRGTFDYSKSVLVGPRPMIKDGTDVHSSTGLIGSNNSSGWWKINPFKLSDRDQVILVNRGWIPLKSPQGHDRGEVQGEVELVGVVRKSERKNQYTPAIRSDDAIFHTRNVSLIAERLEASPIYLDSCITVPGGPIGGQTRVTLPNDHFSYMVTWFSLSGITLYMWIKKFALRR